MGKTDTVKKARRETMTVVPAGRVQVKHVMVRNGLGDSQKKDVYPLILNIVRKKFRGEVGSMEYQDVIAEGLLALVKAQAKFKPKKGVKLTTFAYRRIDGTVHDFIEKEQIYAQRFAVTDEMDLTATSSNRTEAHLSDRHLFLKVVKVIETQLPGKQGAILIRSFLEEATDLEIAQELGIKVADVISQRQQGIDHVRRYILTKPKNTGSWLTDH